MDDEACDDNHTVNGSRQALDYDNIGDSVFKQK